MIKAIIFDCFGVLIGKGFDYTYRMAGGDPEQDRNFIANTLQQANLGLISDTDFRAIMARQVGVSPAAWNQLIEKAERLDTDLLAYIEQLRGSYKTAILSNANNRVLDREIGKDWLKRGFDEVVVSAEVGLAKPDPRVYQLIIDRLGVTPDECLYIDDRPIFLKIASQLGMHVLLYENFEKFKKDVSGILR